jgi:hypothetical protein
MDTYEYIEDRPETWKYHTPPAFPKWFQEGLTDIAGTNRHGKPKLRLVWGGTEKSDKSENYSLKYLAGYSSGVLQGYNYIANGETTFVTDLSDAPDNALVVPATKTEPLGLLRWVIEKWVSPEELERMHRFQNRYLPGEIEPVLREFPREGIYDVFLIVENKQGKFRSLDEGVLSVVKSLWHYQQKPFHERQADDWAAEDAEKERLEKQDAEEWKAVWSADLKLDKEDKERRNEYWAKYAHELRHATDHNP